MSKTLTFDVAVIGGGTAGMVAWRQARQHTDSVVLIEAERFGTTCARVGCMPSKLLIAAADHHHAVSQSDTFGIRVGQVQVDGEAVMARVRRERDRFVDGVLKTIEQVPESHRLLGHARFIDANTLSVGDHLEVKAERFVIATGSRTSIAPPLKAAGSRLITSDDVFEFRTLPESVAVFGPGVIGLELGQALFRLGVRVRMFGIGGAIGPIQDPEVLEQALTLFNREFPLDPDAETEVVDATDQSVTIRFKDSDGNRVEETFEYLLAATGRRPNVDLLGLENTGLRLDEGGLPHFDPHTLQCGNSPIFIAGDANQALPLLHEAADEGRIAGANAGRWPDVRSGLRRTPLSVVFSDPQIMSVGRSLDEVDADCRGCYAVGSVSFANQGRARVMGKNQGLLRLYAEYGSGRFLGAEMIGPAAEHLAHLLAWSIQSGLTVSQMLERPFYHPVIEEGLRTGLQDLARTLKAGPERPGDCMDCGPGV